MNTIKLIDLIDNVDDNTKIIITYNRGEVPLTVEIYKDSYINDKLLGLLDLSNSVVDTIKARKKNVLEVEIL